MGLAAAIGGLLAGFAATGLLGLVTFAADLATGLGAGFAAGFAAAAGLLNAFTKASLSMRSKPLMPLRRAMSARSFLVRLFSVPLIVRPLPGDGGYSGGIRVGRSRDPTRQAKRTSQPF